MTRFVRRAPVVAPAVVVALAALVGGAACVPGDADGGGDAHDAGALRDDGGGATGDGGYAASEDGGGGATDDGGGSVSDDGGATSDDGGGATSDGGATIDDGGGSDAGADADGGGACSGDGQACADGACTALPAAGAPLDYCVAPTPAYPFPCDDAGPGGCCADEDCGQDGGVGVCAPFSYRYCGGAAPPDTNVCRFDACADDEGCAPDQFCAPRGAFGSVVRLCLAAACRTDFDCDDGAGGRCLPLHSGTCGTVGGFYCTYDDDPCRADADCRADGGGAFQVCEPDDDGVGTACVAHPPVP